MAHYLHFSGAETDLPDRQSEYLSRAIRTGYEVCPQHRTPEARDGLNVLYRWDYVSFVFSRRTLKRPQTFAIRPSRNPLGSIG
jgi:hypothetical protein